MHAHLAIVALLEGLGVISLARVLGLSDEAIQAVVDDAEVAAEGSLARHKLCRKGQLPVRQVEGGPVLCLFEHPIHRL